MVLLSAGRDHSAGENSSPLLISINKPPLMLTVILGTPERPTFIDDQSYHVTMY
jgi:hypothetical protein